MDLFGGEIVDIRIDRSQFPEEDAADRAEDEGGEGNDNVEPAD
jgi:hypothetical protein